MASVRKFIRHPSDIPIKVRVQNKKQMTETKVEKNSKINNVSLGGLAFFSPTAFSAGEKITLSVPCLKKHQLIEGSVLWSKASSDGYDVGLEFDDPNAVYQLRMIEQICHIEHYRNEVAAQQGRVLSSEEAAAEWITLFAADFPNFD